MGPIRCSIIYRFLKDEWTVYTGSDTLHVRYVSLCPNETRSLNRWEREREKLYDLWIFETARLKHSTQQLSYGLFCMLEKPTWLYSIQSTINFCFYITVVYWNVHIGSIDRFDGRLRPNTRTTHWYHFNRSTYWKHVTWKKKQIKFNLC